MGDNVDVRMHAEKWMFSLDESTVFGHFYWTKLHATSRPIVIHITGHYVELWMLCKSFSNGRFAGRLY